MTFDFTSNDPIVKKEIQNTYFNSYYYKILKRIFLRFQKVRSIFGLQNDLDFFINPHESSFFFVFKFMLVIKFKIMTGLKTYIIRILPRSFLKVLKKFNAHLQIIFTKQFIADEIVSEWGLWKEKRSIGSKDIFIFSIIAFDYRIQRPQHLAEELAKKGNRVFYIQNEFIPSLKVTNTTVFRASKRSNNLYIVTLASKQNLFIYSDLPSLDDKKVIQSSIRNLLKKVVAINPVAIIDHPFWADLSQEIAMPMIYDCMDEHGGFEENSKNIEKLEEILFEKSEMVIASSDLLLKKVKNKNAKKSLMLKNAGDFDHFNKAFSKLEIPRDIKKIKKPIIGYYGAIAKWFDANLLEKLLKDHIDKSFVLIGRIDNHDVEYLSRKYKNLHLFGEKKYSELPNYLEQFDVCLIPFVINDLIRATNPVKIYEYFAAGKPVVATKIPELEEYKDSMYLSSNEKSFSENINKAIDESKKELVEKRIEVAKNNTWEKRGKVLEAEINKIIFPKISLIIVSYNNHEVLSMCLNSIEKNSYYPNLEVIVVDNNSDKKTIDVIKTYQKKFGVKAIFNNKNLGFARGNNLGLKKSSGDYLVLLNNDTIVSDGWLSRLLFHSRKNNIGLVGPVTNSIGNEAKVKIKHNIFDTNDLFEKSKNYIYQNWGNVMKVNNIAAYCWMMPRQTLSKVGLMDERFGRGLFEDDDYCLRVTKEGLDIVITDDAFVYHFGGASTNWGSVEYKKLFSENKKKFEEKWGIEWQKHKYRNYVK